MTINRYISIYKPTDFQRLHTAQNAKIHISLSFLAGIFLHIPLCFQNKVVLIENGTCNISLFMSAQKHIFIFPLFVFPLKNNFVRARFHVSIHGWFMAFQWIEVMSIFTLIIIYFIFIFDVNLLSFIIWKYFFSRYKRNPLRISWKRGYQQQRHIQAVHHDQWDPPSDWTDNNLGCS